MAIDTREHHIAVLQGGCGDRRSQIAADNLHFGVETESRSVPSSDLHLAGRAGILSASTEHATQVRSLDQISIDHRDLPYAKVRELGESD
jgi:hypothetical protein